MSEKKYNEIMERVEVTDEMRERVMQRVDTHFRAKRTNRAKRWATAAAGLVAAVAILIAVGTQGGPDVPGPGPLTGPEPSAVHAQQTFASAGELSEAVGFEVPEIESLPFAPEETIYDRIGGELAQVTYRNGEDALVFHKAPGPDDVSGDYNSYIEEKTADADGTAVTLKGDGGGYVLAVWTDGSYAYSLSLPEPVDEEALLQMVREAAGR